MKTSCGVIKKILNNLIYFSTEKISMIGKLIFIVVNEKISINLLSM